MKKLLWKLGMGAHTCNSSTQNKKSMDYYEFKVNLVFTVSPRLARVIERDPVSERGCDQNIWENSQKANEEL